MWRTGCAIRALSRRSRCGAGSTRGRGMWIRRWRGIRLCVCMGFPPEPLLTRIPSEMLGGCCRLRVDDLQRQLEGPTEAGFVQIALPEYFAAKTSHGYLAGTEAGQ